MVKFKTKMDSCGKIYISKALRQAGLTNTIEIRPNHNTAVICQAGTRLEDILESLHIIAMELEQQIKTQKDSK